MKKEIIMNVAYKKFSEKGYNATLSEIAEEAGIKKQTIYNYYSDKETLFIEMIKNRIDIYYEFLEAEYQKNLLESPNDRLKNIYLKIVEYFKDISKLNFVKRLLLIEDISLLEKVKDYLKQYDIIFAKRLQKDIYLLTDSALRPDVVIHIVQAFMVMLHGTLDGMLLYHDTYRLDQFAMNVWEVFWSGVEQKIHT